MSNNFFFSFWMRSRPCLKIMGRYRVIILHDFIFNIFFFLITGQRITTIQLDSVQYFVSRMNPYSPELNYFLAYQYCRSLGLQLASFETKEKAESMTQYLSNAGKNFLLFIKTKDFNDLFKRRTSILIYFRS